MVNIIFGKSFIFGAMLFSIAYNSYSIEKKNVDSFNIIADNNNKSINSSIRPNSSSQIKMRLAKKDESKDYIQFTMPIYKLKCDKDGKREKFLKGFDWSNLYTIDIDFKNTTFILERDPLVLKLSVGKLKLNWMNTLKKYCWYVHSYLSDKINDYTHDAKNAAIYNDIRRIDRIPTINDVTTCITIPGFHIDWNISKKGPVSYNKFVVQRNFLERFLSFGEKCKVNFIKSLGFYDNGILHKDVTSDSAVFTVKNNDESIDVKKVPILTLYNMFYMNLINVLTDFSIGRLQVDLNIFYTKLRKKVLIEFFQIKIKSIDNGYDNTKTSCCSASNFSLYCKLSNEGEKSNNRINYNVELSGIFKLKHNSEDFKKFLILPRKPKDYEDFIQNISPLKSFDKSVLTYEDDNRLKVYFNGVFSLKRIEFYHNNVAFTINLFDFSFGIHGQGHIQQDDFSVFNVKNTGNKFAIYVAPFIIKMELIKDGIIVVKWIPFTYDNRSAKGSTKFSKNLDVSLNPNKLYNWLFGKKNVL